MLMSRTMPLALAKALPEKKRFDPDRIEFHESTSNLSIYYVLQVETNA